MTGCITDVPGIRVGHSTLADAGTGCTVVLAADGASAGVDVRGALPGTSETAILAPTSATVPMHAILLAGGSDFGLRAASGVAEFLEERGLGFRTGRVVVPARPGRRHLRAGRRPAPMSVRAPRTATGRASRPLRPASSADPSGRGQARSSRSSWVSRAA